MEARPLFLLFVSTFAQAASSHPWPIIRRATELPDNTLFAAHRLMAIEDLAFEFVSWQIGEREMPGWVNLRRRSEAVTHPDLTEG